MESLVACSKDIVDDYCACSRRIENLLAHGVIPFRIELSIGVLKDRNIDEFWFVIRVLSLLSYFSRDDLDSCLDRKLYCLCMTIEAFVIDDDQLGSSSNTDNIVFSPCHQYRFVLFMNCLQLLETLLEVAVDRRAL